MRILHTSDWHLGKSLVTKSRLNEQREVLDFLIETVQKESIDVLLVCGDIFDTFVPKAEAEELFFEKLVLLSRFCTVICISGNHDDGDRLGAPSPIAVFSNIFLVGGLDNTQFTHKNITGGEGFITIKKNDETLNLALLPYPFFSQIISQTEGNSTEERLDGLIKKCCKCFKEGEINIFASHLFVDGSELSEDRELGTAPLVPISLLPECDYVALGHIHKPQFVSKKKKVVYSGSLLKYSFDDKFDKYFYIFDSSDKSVSKIGIPGQKLLITLQTDKIEEIEKTLIENECAYVKVIYTGRPLELSEIKRIKSYPAFTDIKFENQREGIKKSFKADSSPEELFKSFYTQLSGIEPEKEMTDLFLSVLGGVCED